MSSKESNLSLPDSGWISDVSDVVSNHGAIGAGVMLIAIGFILFSIGFTASGNNKTASWIGSGVLAAIGVFVLVAGIINPPPTRYYVADLQNVPTTYTVASTGEKTYVKAQRVDGCIRDSSIVLLDPQESIRVRLIPRFQFESDSSNLSPCTAKYIPTDIYALHYVVSNQYLRKYPKRTYLNYDSVEKEIVIEHEEINDGKPVTIEPSKLAQLSPAPKQPLDYAFFVSRANAQMTSSVDKQSKAAPISETFSGILSLFASGDFSEIWNGVEQLATGYSEYYPFMVKTLSDQRSNGFEKLGLLLSFRRHFKELYYENEPIPEYDADFLKALLDLSVSETPLLKNNARILLRTKPTAKTKEQFDTYFERMTDIEKKKRLAGVAADLYYNFAIETAFDKKDDGSNELELSPKSQNVDLAIDALSQAWSFRDKGLPQDTSLFVKALYGRGFEPPRVCRRLIFLRKVSLWNPMDQ